jgi:hypothetical protein
MRAERTWCLLLITIPQGTTAALLALAGLQHLSWHDLLIAVILGADAVIIRRLSRDCA